MRPRTYGISMNTLIYTVYESNSFLSPRSHNGTRAMFTGIKIVGNASTAVSLFARDPNAVAVYILWWCVRIHACQNPQKVLSVWPYPTRRRRWRVLPRKQWIRCELAAYYYLLRVLGCVYDLIVSSGPKVKEMLPRPDFPRSTTISTTLHGPSDHNIIIIIIILLLWCIIYYGYWIYVRHAGVNFADEWLSRYRDIDHGVTIRLSDSYIISADYSYYYYY